MRSLMTTFEGKLAEAELKGADEAFLDALKARRKIYRDEVRTQYIATFLPDPVTDVVHSTVPTDEGLVHIATRVSRMSYRPLFAVDQGIPARCIAFDPTTPVLQALARLAMDEGYELATWKGRRGDFVRKGTARHFLAAYGVTSTTPNVHDLVRAKVYTGRPGGLVIPLDFTGTFRYTSAKNDGTVAITGQVSAPYQGTLLGTDEKTMYKGIVRPPLHVKDRPTEGNQCAREGAFKHLIADKSAFHVLSDLPSSRASLNLQAVLFGAEDPVAVIRADTRRLEAFDPMAHFTPAERRKVAAGVPMAVFTDPLAPWKTATQLHVEGVREAVFGSMLVHPGEVCLLPATLKAMKRAHRRAFGDESDLVEGDTIVLHRDPALPDASSMGQYTLGPPARWDGNHTGSERGIVLNPGDPQWKRAGGDFDGDAAVAFIKTFALANCPRTSYAPSPRYAPDETRPDVVKGLDTDKHALFKAVRDDLLGGLSTRLAPTITAAQRICESGLLTDFERVFVADLAQACVDAQKHRVNAKAGIDDYIALCERVPTRVYMLDKLRDIRREPGMREKEIAWNEMMAALPEEDPDYPVTQALIERTRALDDLYRRTAFVRRGHAQLGTAMKEAADATLVPDERAWIKEWDKQFKALKWELAQARTRNPAQSTNADRLDSDAATHELRLQIDRRLYTLHKRLLDGLLPETALVAYATAEVAAKYVSVETFEELGCMLTECYTGIRRLSEDEWLMPHGTAGKIAVGEVKPLLFPMEYARDAQVLALPDDTMVDIRVVDASPYRKDGGARKSQQIHISWE